MASSGFSFAHSNSNAILAYKDSAGSYAAKVRVPTVGYTYGVASDESHARKIRAFYPHRRTLGQFALQVDCIHYKEYMQLVNWLKAYADSLLNSAESSAIGVPLLTVSVPSRKFTRIGFITTGMDDHDQAGSMLFTANLIFVALSDPNDPMTSILTQKGAISFFQPASVDTTGINGTEAFYPSTVSAYRDPSAPVYDGGNSTPQSVYITQAINKRDAMGDNGQ